jgi:hypothetical protein
MAAVLKKRALAEYTQTIQVDSKNAIKEKVRLWVLFLGELFIPAD